MRGMRDSMCHGGCTRKWWGCGAGRHGKRVWLVRSCGMRAMLVGLLVHVWGGHSIVPRMLRLVVMFHGILTSR
jgi:hypothetical protein